MFWNKKKKAEDYSQLPDLPEDSEMQISSMSNTLPELNEEKDLPELPSFPASEIADSISQAAIKSELKGMIVKPYTKEIGASGQKEVMKMPEARIMPRVSLEETKKEPIFVRIDKFQTALKNFEEIGKQLSGIERYLAEIKEIKDKEDAEIIAWARELEEIKVKLAAIDETIFNKLE